MTSAEYLAEAVKLLEKVSVEDVAAGYRNYENASGTSRSYQPTRQDRVYLFLRSLEANPPKDAP